SDETRGVLDGGALDRRGPARPRRATRRGSRSPPALERTHPLTTLPPPACERTERPMLNADTVHSIIQTLGRGIWSSTTTPAGVLVTLSGKDTDDVINALRAAGYTATEVGSGTVMVGGVDRIALLDAQIAALTAQRARLAQDREVLDRMEDVMGGPF